MFVSKLLGKKENIQDLQINLLKGVSVSDCAEKFGVSTKRIYQIIKKNKLFSSYEEYGLGLKKAQERERIDNERALSTGISLTAFQASREDSFQRICYDKFKLKQNNASRLGIEFNIIYDNLEFPLVCPVLGIPLDYTKNSKRDNRPTFDRIDPSLGYVEDNVHIISMRANRIKNDATVRELQLVYKYFDTLEHMGYSYVYPNKRIYKPEEDVYPHL